MGLLDSTSKTALVESMRHALIDSVQKNETLTESVQVESVRFVQEDATYEQLLNMTLNPLRESKYLPSHTLEGAVAILSEAMLTGRKVIGINALTEGALNLVKKTDCVVTESMLDAAHEAAQSRALDIVAESIVLVQEDLARVNKVNQMIKDADAEVVRLRKNVSKGGKFKKEFQDALKKAEEKLAKAKEVRAKLQDHEKKMIKGGKTAILSGTPKAGKLAKSDSKKAAGGVLKKAGEALKNNKGKAAAVAGGLAAAGLATYGIKKWHDKKQNERAAASKAK